MKLKDPRPAIHTVCSGPKNLHGMKVAGHVIEVNAPFRRVKFTDGRTTKWVREDTVEYDCYAAAAELPNG